MRTETEAIENRVVVVVEMVVVVVDVRIAIEIVHADEKRVTELPKVDQWVAHQHKTDDLKYQHH